MLGLAAIAREFRQVLRFRLNRPANLTTTYRRS